MSMITLKEYAERHGKAPDVARQKALRGTFRTAVKIGRDWMIDENEPYLDARRKKRSADDGPAVAPAAARRHR